MIALRTVVLLVVVVAVIAGCGRTGPPQHLPKPAHWYGSEIWVPQGYANALAPVVCRNGEQRNWWFETPYPAGGELIHCEGGVKEQYES